MSIRPLRRLLSLYRDLRTDSKQMKSYKYKKGPSNSPYILSIFSQPDFNIKQDVEPTRTILDIETIENNQRIPITTAIIKNFIIDIIICFLASIAIADTHNITLVEGIKLFEFLPPGAPIDLDKSGIVFRHVWSPFQWSLSLICELDNLSNDINCFWTARPTQIPISTQPIRKDFVFELESEGKSRQTDLEPLYVSWKSNIIEVNPLILPADYAEMEKKLGSPFVAFSMKVNCMREYGPESILWCER
ncbi:hypothetical protein BPAE_0137g00130 [Botrytis paeoniae]|uniref:Uncharacterized protein n=1 Tax=Botrytis paeoniae TaxID=278948 RepID=A0A4Z1FKW8_9HELO|nr:hypothetical protein BPAE_0137g00130 [Botrytis paeoniae]